MYHGFLTAALAMARMWPTTSMSRRLLSGLAVASLLVAGSAARGGQPPPMTAQRKSNPEMGSPVTHAGSAGSAVATAAGAPPVDPASLRRRREAIAHLLEGTLAYRTAIDNGAPKLLETKFAGPFEYPTFFSGPETVYCASAKIPFWLIPDTRVAVIRVERAENGSERIRATVGLNNTPRECRLAKYGPFPELELARQKRRQALGKAD
jgi:hypothetical protein